METFPRIIGICFLEESSVPAMFLTIFEVEESFTVSLDEFRFFKDNSKSAFGKATSSFEGESKMMMSGSGEVLGGLDCMSDFACTLSSSFNFPILTNNFKFSLRSFSINWFSLNS